jgi:ribonucleoside-diphosphate reductase alpha chain
MTGSEGGIHAISGGPKYRLPDADFALEDTWRRVARTLASVEAGNQRHWEDRFVSVLRDFRFLAGGRIQAGAGTSRNVTLFNCFVMGAVEDSIPGIFLGLREAAITMQQGGGIGVDFSTLRPRGTQAKAGGNIASGPVSFMEVWDAMCGTILSTGARRGAMMATLRCDHPDIEEFVTAKQMRGRLRRFNLSVQVTDAFMAAVKADEDWPLVFPAKTVNGRGETVLRDWAGALKPVACCILRSIPARKLWEVILRGCYDYAEPAVLFVDRINRLNNLSYCERITAANPAG